MPSAPQGPADQAVAAGWLLAPDGTPIYWDGERWTLSQDEYQQLQGSPPETLPDRFTYPGLFTLPDGSLRYWEGDRWAASPQGPASHAEEQVASIDEEPPEGSNGPDNEPGSKPKGISAPQALLIAGALGMAVVVTFGTLMVLASASWGPFGEEKQDVITQVNMSWDHRTTSSERGTICQWWGINPPHAVELWARLEPRSIDMTSGELTTFFNRRC